MSPPVHQTEHGLLCEVLRGFLIGTVVSSRGADGCGRAGYGAGAALYSLLAAHPVDGRGRCRSCRGRRWWGRRRQVCLVFLTAHYWLRQPSHIVQAHLVAELGIDGATPRGAADPEATEVPGWVEPHCGDSRAEPCQTPAVLSPLSPGPRGAGRLDLDHGGVGVYPECPDLSVAPWVSRCRAWVGRCWSLGV
jgi:hypothetical protein